MDDIRQIFKPLSMKKAKHSSEEETLYNFKRSSPKMIVRDPYVKVVKPIYSRILEEKGKE